MENEDESWMVENPGRPLLFHAEDYEENPKRRGRRRKRTAKAMVKAPRRHRRRRTHRAKIAVVAPKPKRHRRRRAHRAKAPKAMKVGRKARRRGRRRSKRPFTFLKAWKHKRRGYKPFKTPKGTKFFMGPKSKFEENPRRKRRRGGRRRKAFSLNFAASNPKRRFSKRRHYASNPLAKLNGGKFYNLPTMGELKGQGAVKSILFGFGGLVTSNLVGMGIDYAFQKYSESIVGKEGAVAPSEYMVDGARIFGKLAIGSAISWAMGKYVLKSNVAAKTWQTGVYIATGLDIAGTIVKYLTRSTAQVKLGGPIRAPATLGNVAMGVLGAGSFGSWWYENQVRDAIYKTGRVEVVGNEKGHVGIMHPGTGKIIMSGPEKQMASVLGAIQKSVLKTGNDLEQDKVIGEDITIEA